MEKLKKLYRGITLIEDNFEHFDFNTIPMPNNVIYNEAGEKYVKNG